MTYSIFDASIVPVQHSLESLKTILKKAEASADSSSFAEARIHPDMLPLAFQIHMMTNVCFPMPTGSPRDPNSANTSQQTSQQAVARLSGTEAKSFENNLKSFAEFYARIDEVAAIVKSADRSTIESRSDSTISIGFGPGKSVDLSATGYVNGWLVPNLFFHLTTAYNILRKEGVELGKLDFLGAFVGQYADLKAAGIQ